LIISSFATNYLGDKKNDVDVPVIGILSVKKLKTCKWDLKWR
jgi:hypothetical protein